MDDLLGLEGLQALQVKESDGECVIEAEGTGVVSACPDCGPVLGRLYSHGTQTQSFRDTQMRGMPMHRLLEHIRRHVFGDTFAA